MSCRNDRGVTTRCATATLALTVRSSNSSTDCHVRRRPSRARACGCEPVQFDVTQPDGAGGADEPGHGIDERGLAGPVGPDQTDDVAGTHVDRHPVVGDESPVADAQVGHREPYWG